MVPEALNVYEISYRKSPKAGKRNMSVRKIVQKEHVGGSKPGWEEARGKMVEPAKN